VTFVFPESLSKEQRAKAAEQYHGSIKGKSRATVLAINGNGSEQTQEVEPQHVGVVTRFLSPLSMFLPAVIMTSTGNGIKKTRDWSLTLLALTMFLFMLATV